jgi:hypothetical protein
MEGPVDPHRRRVKPPTASANRQQRDPSDQRFDNPSARIKGQGDPLFL